MAWPRASEPLRASHFAAGRPHPRRRFAGGLGPLTNGLVSPVARGVFVGAPKVLKRVLVLVFGLFNGLSQEKHGKPLWFAKIPTKPGIHVGELRPQILKDTENIPSPHIPLTQYQLE